MPQENKINLEQTIAKQAKFIKGLTIGLIISVFGWGISTGIFIEKYNNLSEKQNEDDKLWKETLKFVANATIIFEHLDFSFTVPARDDEDDE